MSAQTTTGTATENTINVIENNRLLTEEQLKTAVEMFATGKNRTEVAQFFIDTVPDLQVLDATDPKGLRKRLSNALRVADPTSDQFSKTKYKELYDLHRESLREVLQNKYDRAVQKYANFLERQIEKINDRIEAFQHMIDKSFTHDTMPVSQSRNKRHRADTPESDRPSHTATERTPRIAPTRQRDKAKHQMMY